MPDDGRKTDFQTEFSWSRTWIPRIRQIIGPWLLREGNEFEDQREATDLIVLKLEGARIACRVRRPGYSNFPDITITCRRETGAPCEYNKLILGGYGDYFFYGHATNDDARAGDILPRYLIDMSVARPWIAKNHGPELGPNKDNLGRRCWFYGVNPFAMNDALAGKALVAHRGKPPVYVTTLKNFDDLVRNDLGPMWTLDA